MYKRRYRRKRGTWLPVVGTDLAEGADTTVLLQTGVEIPVNGTTAVGIIPLLFDDPNDVAELSLVENQMVQAVGTEYAIQAILGKIDGRVTWVATDGVTNADFFEGLTAAFLVKCGFFVARAEDTSGAQDSLPIGAGSTAQLRSNYSPLSINTQREPWMWQRSWVLQPHMVVQNGSSPSSWAEIGVADVNPAFSGYTALSGIARFPETISGHVGANVGSHIHIKTRRRVRQDERLWFAIAAQTWPIGSALNQIQHPIANVSLDIRLRGALRRAVNRSAF